MLLKLDYLCPTGSYKDRGSSVMVSALKEAGLTALVEDSSGNAGASIAAYAARASMSCTICVLADSSLDKRIQIKAYGANIIEVSSSRQDVAEACQRMAATRKNVFYASHNWNPLFLAGMKTLAYEIADEILPDWLVPPAGYGSLVVGTYRGFCDLLRWGRISRMPRLVVVQSSACSPIFQAFVRGSADVFPIRPGRTIAEGIACPAPIRGSEILEAVRISGGVVSAVEDTEIAEACLALARKGVYVEPTSAAVIAAVKKLL